jgi:hypothetical protein
MHVELHGQGESSAGTLVFYPLDGPLRGQELRREVSGPDCESVASSLAMVAAVIVESATAVRSAPSGPEKGPEAADVHPRDRPPLDQRPAPGSPASARITLGAAFEVATGLGPDPTAAPRAFLGTELVGALSSVSLRLSVGRSFTRTVGTAVGNAEITRTDLRFEPCYAFAQRPWFRVEGCALIDGGVLVGTGTRTTAASDATRPLLELGMGLRPTVSLGNAITLGLLAGAQVSLWRYRFYFSSPDTTAYALAAWSAILEVGLGVRL